MAEEGEEELHLAVVVAAGGVRVALGQHVVELLGDAPWNVVVYVGVGDILSVEVPDQSLCGATGRGGMACTVECVGVCECAGAGTRL